MAGNPSNRGNACGNSHYREEDNHKREKCYRLALLVLLITPLKRRLPRLLGLLAVLL